MRESCKNLQEAPRKCTQRSIFSCSHQSPLPSKRSQQLRASTTTASNFQEPIFFLSSSSSCSGWLWAGRALLSVLAPARIPPCSSTTTIHMIAFVQIPGELSCPLMPIWHTLLLLLLLVAAQPKGGIIWPSFSFLSQEDLVILLLRAPLYVLFPIPLCHFL